MKKGSLMGQRIITWTITEPQQDSADPFKDPEDPLKDPVDLAFYTV